MLARLTNALIHYNHFSGPIRGLRGAEGLGARLANCRYVAFGIVGDVVRMAVGDRPDNLHALEVKHGDGVDAIGRALVAMELVRGNERYYLSLAGMNAAETRDVLRAIVRRHVIPNPLMGTGEASELGNLPFRAEASHILYHGRRFSPQERTAALETLCEIDQARLIEHIGRGLDDESSIVRQKAEAIAISQLSHLTAQKTGGIIVKALLERRNKLRPEAVSSVLELAHRHHRVWSDSNIIIPSVADCLKNATDPTVISRAADLLTVIAITRFGEIAATILQRKEPDLASARDHVLHLVTERVDSLAGNQHLARAIRSLATTVSDPLAGRARTLLEDLDPIARLSVTDQTDWFHLIGKYAIPEPGNIVTSEQLAQDESTTIEWVARLGIDERIRVMKRVRRILLYAPEKTADDYIRTLQIQYKVATLLLPHIAFVDTDPGENIVHVVAGIMSRQPRWRPGLLRTISILGGRYSNGALYTLAQIGVFEANGTIRHLARRFFTQALAQYNPRQNRIADPAISGLPPQYLIDAVAQKRKIAGLLGFDADAARDEEPFDAESEDSPRAIVQRAAYVLWRTDNLGAPDLDGITIHDRIKEGLQHRDDVLNRAAQHVLDAFRTRPGQS